MTADCAVEEEPQRVLRREEQARVGGVNGNCAVGIGIARRESELRGVNRNCARACAEKSSARIIASCRWSSAGAQPGARLARWRWRWSQWLR